MTASNVLISHLLQQTKSVKDEESSSDLDSDSDSVSKSSKKNDTRNEPHTESSREQGTESIFPPQNSQIATLNREMKALEVRYFRTRLLLEKTTDKVHKFCVHLFPMISLEPSECTTSTTSSEMSNKEQEKC